jgi:hypothetical protein
VFYTQRHVYYIPDIQTDDFRVLRQPSPAMVYLPMVYVMLKTRDLETLRTVYPLTLLQQGRIYSLVRIPNLSLRKDLNQ